MQEVRAGLPQSSAVTTTTSGSRSPAIDDEAVWQELRKKLANGQIPTTVLDDKKEFILSWFKQATQAPPSSSSQDASSIGTSLSNPRPVSGAVNIPLQSLGRPVRNSTPPAPKSPPTQTGSPKVDLVSSPVGKKSPISAKVQRFLISNNAKMEFIQAAQRNDVPAVQKLVKKGMDIDFQPKDGETALVAAARAGSHAVLQWLLQQGADTEVMTVDGMNALHVACANGKQYAVQLLLDSGADVTARTTVLLHTALHLAAERGNLELVRLLVERRANLDAVTDRGWTALTHAVVKRNIPTASYLLSMGTHIITDDLLQAVESGNPDLVLLLLDHGADIAAISHGKDLEDGTVDRSGKKRSMPPLHGFAAIHVASREGNVEIVRILLQHGADPTLQTEKGYTPLHFACFSGNADLVRLLLGHGVDVDAKTSDGSTSLHVAAHYGRPSTRQTIVQILLDHGANVSAVMELQQTALHRFFSAQGITYEGVARLLIDRGININTAMHGGKTAIHLAALNADDAVLEFLLSRGADVMAKCDEGRSPLHYAASATGIDAETKAKRMIKLLQHGANISATDNLGKTALEYVRDDGTAQRISQWRKTKNTSRYVEGPKDSR
jgi:ankyrin repeat protein